MCLFLSINHFYLQSVDNAEKIREKVCLNIYKSRKRKMYLCILFFKYK